MNLDEAVQEFVWNELKKLKVLGKIKSDLITEELLAREATTYENLQASHLSVITPVIGGKMMEESSDESTEIITKEEAEQAEQQHQAEQIKTPTVTSPGVPGGTPGSTIPPPAPLPVFQSGSPSTVSTRVAQVPVTPQAQGPVVTPTVASTLATDALSSAQPTIVSQVKAPDPIQSPYEASSDITVPLEIVEATPQSPIPSGARGLFGWISGNKLVSRVMEKTKSSVESMITTLDPGMKEIICEYICGCRENLVKQYRHSFHLMYTSAVSAFISYGVHQQYRHSFHLVYISSIGIHFIWCRLAVSAFVSSGVHQQYRHSFHLRQVLLDSGGDISVIVTSTAENKVGAVREAFQEVFRRATVMGKESQATTAAQPVGFTAGLKGAEERIQNLRRSGDIPESQPVVSVEGFIVELLPDRWYEMSCLVLKDPEHRIDLQVFSQPTLIPAEYILTAQDRTPSDYPLRWSGLAVSIGYVIEEAQPHIGHADWQKALIGISRRESLYLAAKSLAYMYKQRLPSSFIS
ncbi:hypothetical protein CHS0354_004400 [Potamilus streckersoni]|uniref:Non-canonical purine NTP phosphatase/PRRC1 domain-containing protein n=1 Tax=Potamilus streckersoni TaxID=2493646 RepID=A0AAE0W5P6_9BIVA|nr:hypothetical protein CHS0354_004400 [Potamilus streckersoni]